MKFEEKFFISTCYSSLPFALSTRWLAFVDVRLNVIHQSSGGIDGTISEQNTSYTATVLSAAKVISKSMVKIGESVLGYGNSAVSNNNTNMNEKIFANQQPSGSSTSSTNSNNMNNNNNNSSSASTNASRHRHNSVKDETQPGVLTIVDCVKLFGVRFISIEERNG